MAEWRERLFGKSIPLRSQSVTARFELVRANDPTADPVALALGTGQSMGRDLTGKIMRAGATSPCDHTKSG